MNKLLTVLSVVSLFTGSFGLLCWECSEATDNEHCQKIGRLRQCMFNQDACEIEIRKHEGWGGHKYIYKHCKQSKACDNNHIQNPRSAWVPSQCNLDDVNSVCRCCCYENECNVAQDACFSRRGCYALPTNIPYGSISCTAGNDEGSICTVSCNGNTRLSGTASVSCRGDGSWSNDLAQCLYHQCPVMNHLNNGWYVCTNSYFAGSRCTAQCRPGFTLVGAEVLTCVGSSLRWNYNPPQCRGMSCPDRGIVAGGVVNCSDGNNQQSRCDVECQGSRRLDGIKHSYCRENGEWSHPLPVCATINCPQRGTIVNGQVDCNDGTEVNSICRASCDEGYGPDALLISTCLPTGNWDRPLPRCQMIMCPPRGRLVGGTVRCTGGSHVASECTAECNQGTALVGSSTSICQSDGTWDFPLPTCQAILCPERNRLEGGELDCKQRTVDSICRAMCDYEKRMVGSPSAVCNPDGEWSEPLPTCEDIDCPSLDFSSQRGFMTCTNDFSYRSRCSFECEPGYSLRGAPFVSCRRNGRWTTRMPVCALTECGRRGRVRFGTVDCSNGVAVGSECNVVCNEGYAMNGRDRSVCLPSGRWSNGLPVCEPIICPIRDSLLFGSVDCLNRNVFGSVCTATCDEGRELIGSRLSTCGADGNWDVDLPSCRSLPCADQGVLEHGSIQCTNSWNVLSRCTFQCLEEGYELYPEGTTNNLCAPNRNWNIPKPCCTRPCPPYAVMDIVLVLDSSSSIGTENWALLTNFVEGVITTFRVAPDLANFALFRYNREVDTTTQIFLNTHPADVDAVVAALRAIPYNGSGTFTGVALDHALTESLSIANGNRPDVKDIVMVITDGKAADDVKTPSDALRAAGVQILVLGIEPPRGRLDEEQLLDIAGGPDNLIIARGGFAGLDTAFTTTLGTFICGEPCT